MSGAVVKMRPNHFVHAQNDPKKRKAKQNLYHRA